VTPTVDGHPDVCEVLAAGQLFSRQLLSFMRDLGTMEIHGYKPDFGYRVYTEKAIEMTDQPDVPTATDTGRWLPSRPRPRQPDRGGAAPSRLSLRLEYSRPGSRSVGHIASTYQDLQAAAVD
jgi:hypothetical protein